MFSNNNDAFGAALMDCFLGKETHYIVEREDGFADPGSLMQYFTAFADWGPLEQHMPELVHGRVLDVGCGAGRHALYLQDLGFEVVGIDKSPLAIEVAKQRGVKQAYAISLDELAGREAEMTGLGAFDSVIMMGHNIGLLHGRLEGRNILEGLNRITSSGARIVGTTRDPGETTDPDHLAYQEWNRKRGRMPGQIRFRIRHRKLASDWLDYLFLSEEEFRHLAEGTGWRLETAIKGTDTFSGAGSYLAVLGKE
jgi:SAM-dependent methyltransferase